MLPAAFQAEKLSVNSKKMCRLHSGCWLPGYWNIETRKTNCYRSTTLKQQTSENSLTYKKKHVKLCLHCEAVDMYSIDYILLLFLQASSGHTSLAAAAASLSTELLSPMAFITSTARKTPPAVSSQGKSTNLSWLLTWTSHSRLGQLCCHKHLHSLTYFTKFYILALLLN